jgi:hypothetical protein
MSAENATPSLADADTGLSAADIMCDVCCVFQLTHEVAETFLFSYLCFI